MDKPTDLRSQLRRNKEPVVPTLPPKDPRDIGPKSELKQLSVSLPIWLWERLDEIGKGSGYGRNEMFREVMKQFADEQDAKLKKAK